MYSLIGYAVGNITTGLPRWMYVFIIFGAVSVATGIWSLLVLPDLPSTARFLTERERAIAVERVAANRQGVKNRHFKWYQVKQAALDPKTWLLFVMAVGAQVPNSALTSVRTEHLKGYIYTTHTNRSVTSSHPSSSNPSASTPSAHNISRSQGERYNSSRCSSAG